MEPLMEDSIVDADSLSFLEFLESPSTVEYAAGSAPLDDCDTTALDGSELVSVVTEFSPVGEDASCSDDSQPSLAMYDSTRKKLLTIIDQLHDLGVTKDDIYKMYVTDVLPVSTIHCSLNEALGSKVLSVRQVNHLITVLGLPKRSKEDSLKLRGQGKRTEPEPDKKAYGIKKAFSANDLVAMYNSGLGLSEIVRKTGVNSQVLNTLISNSPSGFRKKSFEKIVEDFEKAGFTKEDLDTKYVSSTRKETTQWMESVIGREILYKDFTTILRHYNLRKNVPSKRSKKNDPEANKAYDLKRLAKVGFNNVQEVADYFESNKNMSYSKLLVDMNSKLDADDVRFTPFWLEHNMIPLLPFNVERFPAHPRTALPQYYGDPDCRKRKWSSRSSKRYFALATKIANNEEWKRVLQKAYIVDELSVTKICSILEAMCEEDKIREYLFPHLINLGVIPQRPKGFAREGL